MKRYFAWIVQHRKWVVAATLIVTVLLVIQIKNLRVIIDPDGILPQQHPLLVATNEIEKKFGSRYMIVIGIRPNEGDIYNPTVLAKVERITSALIETPGVVRENVLSLSARKAKDVKGTQEGMLVRPLMGRTPLSEEELRSLRRAILTNPVYMDSIVSQDGKVTAIIAELKHKKGSFREVVAAVTEIVNREKDGTVSIAVSGRPFFLVQLEKYSQRMGVLFLLAVLITGLIHYEAFRTAQGLILPLITAILAVFWGLGIMQTARVPMDVFNSTTPILILAVAAGHAVQILKRYYEEYHRLCRDPSLDPTTANKAAVVESLTRIGPAMLTSGIVAALGFLSLMVFQITTIRTFGIFTGLGILSALVLEMTFIPALRSMLPAPKEREGKRESKARMWDWITARFADWVIGRYRWRIYAVSGLLFLLAAIGAGKVIVDNSTKNFFFDSLPLKKEDTTLNRWLAGTNTLYIMISGTEEDTIKDPQVLRGMEAIQGYLATQEHVGKTVSIVDFIKRMNRAMHNDDPKFDRIPESRELISQYLLLYSMSGDPADFDSYVDYKYQAASIAVFLRTDSTRSINDLIGKLREQGAILFDKKIKIGIGGGTTQGVALNEVLVHDKVINILQIAGVVLIIVTVVFRSLIAGVFVLIPLLFAVIMNFGIMGWAGIDLNIATSTISAMAVGIGADYAIYLIYRIREELARGVSEDLAVRTALTTAGKAVLYVASAIAGGYGVLLLSYGFYIHIYYALLIATSMLVSACAALTLLPALIINFRPAFVYNGTEQLQAKLSQTVGMILVLVAAGLLGVHGSSSAAQIDARGVMERNFFASKVMDSKYDATFTLINKEGQQRIRKTEGTTKLQANGLDTMRSVRFLSPPDVKGTATLMVEHTGKDDDMWIYLPALKKVRRLVSSNKKDSFVGTDFSYGDVIGHRLDDWTHAIVSEEAVDGQPCYVVESLPANEEAKVNSGYSKRKTWVRKDNFVGIKGEYWDLTGQLLKTSRLTNVQKVDAVNNKWQAMQYETANNQTGHHTVIEFSNFKANTGVKDDFFTTRHLEQQ